MGRGKSKGAASGNSAIGASALTAGEAAKLQEQAESGFDAATRKSVSKYISNTDFDGMGHSMSQTANYIINNGGDLQSMSRTEINSKYGLVLSQTQYAALQKMDANIDAAMHPIGQSVTLQRGAHAGELLRNFGITDYASMSEAELKQKLVGATFKNKAVMSTSYDVIKNPFLGSGPASGGREVVYTIKAGANTKVVFGATSQSELIIGKGTNWRVADVRYTGKQALPKSTMKYTPQVEIVIETY